MQLVTEPVAPLLDVTQLRAIFLRPDVPLKLPEDDCLPRAATFSIRPEIPFAQHECDENNYAWVELWAIPTDGGHVADQWFPDWRVSDEDGRSALAWITYCPFCGANLDEQINTWGFYQYVNEPWGDECQAGEALNPAPEEKC